MRFFSTLGICSGSSFCRYPRSYICRASQSLTVIIERPPDSPFASSGCIFPKNSTLSLMSSTHLTSTPVLSSNSATVPSLPGSTYSGHCEIVTSPEGSPFAVGTVCTSAFAPPSMPESPHAATSTASRLARASATVIL